MTRQVEARRFRFGPPAGLGVAGSLRASQLSCLVGGVATALGAAWVLPVAAAPLALVPIVVGAAGAFVPTPWGVPLIDAARLAAGHLLARRRGGQARWRSLRPESAGLDGEGRVETPRSWGRLRVTGHLASEGEVGLLVDDALRTVSATMLVRSDALELAGEAERSRRVEAFGALLGALATSPERLRRVAWHERTLPAEADAIGKRLAQRRSAEARPDSVSAYLELIDRATREAVDHECLVTVEADARRVVRRAGETPQSAAGRVAVDALR
ncbi:MAG TPA: SCO6880 family protein, partial [Solirubrobacteraceae bacterium]|nr:SCO6880 family protein [Solirubrobacteraceae bacterium]